MKILVTQGRQRNYLYKNVLERPGIDQKIGLEGQSNGATVGSSNIELKLKFKMATKRILEYEILMLILIQLSIEVCY